MSAEIRKAITEMRLDALAWHADTAARAVVQVRESLARLDAPAAARAAAGDLLREAELNIRAALVHLSAAAP